MEVDFSLIKALQHNLCEDAKRIQAGDTLAFQRVFHILYEPVYNRAVQVLKNHADAADTTQDVFIKVWQKKLKWDPSVGNFMGWFLVLAERSIIDAYRKQQRELKKHTDSFDMNLIDAGDSEDTDAVFTILELVPDRQPDGLGHVVADEILQNIETALLSVLNPKHRLAWILRHFEGYSTHQISKIMGYPANTCKIWVHRCQVKIREVLAETYEHR